MGSPVSVVVAEIVMQNIEEQALATYSEILPLWLRKHENKIDEFQEHLNEQNTNIQFTKEIEENGKIPFLDCLVTRENNTLRANHWLQETNRALLNTGKEWNGMERNGIYRNKPEYT